MMEIEPIERLDPNVITSSVDNLYVVLNLNSIISKVKVAQRLPEEASRNFHKQFKR